MFLWNAITTILLLLAVMEIVRNKPTIASVVKYPSWTGFTFLWLLGSIALHFIK
jgi:hypothetical protein